MFLEFRAYAGEITKTELGSMVSMASGKALDFSLAKLQERGVLYIKAGDEIYEGMVVGNTSKGEDMAVNPTTGKQLTNMRASGSDGTVKLSPPLEITLERALSIMRDDEFVEITPNIVRLRKQYLTETDRKRKGRK
jgi:GTP-binding protein